MANVDMSCFIVDPNAKKSDLRDAIDLKLSRISALSRVAMNEDFANWCDDPNTRDSYLATIVQLSEEAGVLVDALDSAKGRGEPWLTHQHSSSTQN